MLQSILAFLKDRIGFHRLGLAVSAALIGFAIYVLAGKLSAVSWTRVGQAIGEMGTLSLVLAGLCTLACYVMLTAYDYFATRTIGRPDVPVVSCGIGAFTSYAIAHNLGATVFTATVVRYLVYARYGLGARDVIKISFIAGLTFWLGNGLVLGLGFSLEPEVVAPIAEHIGLGATQVRIVGLGLLAALVGWLIFVAWPRQVGRGMWTIRLPGTGLTGFQMLIGLADICLCAGIFYILLMAIPGVPAVGFQVVAVVFAASMLLGFASHAPGAAGAFEATLLIALPPLGFATEAVVAAFIMFRLYYFVAPFLVALVVVALREFASGRRPLAHLRESMAVIREAEGQHKAAGTAAPKSSVP